MTLPGEERKAHQRALGVQSGEPFQACVTGASGRGRRYLGNAGTRRDPAAGEYRDAPTARLTAGCRILGQVWSTMADKSRLLWQPGGMNVHPGPGRDGTAAPGGGRRAAVWAEFVPLAFNDCLGWVRITVPPPGARAACLSVTAHIHLMQPRIPLRELDAQAESAIRALEDGAGTGTVVNEFHRVDRTGMHAPAGETES